MDTASTGIVSDNPNEMQAAIVRMLKQIDELHAQMEADGIAIARLKAENAELKAEE